jgi:hypothetical protein
LHSLASFSTSCSEETWGHGRCHKRKPTTRERRCASAFGGESGLFALARARKAEVDADVEAAIRNYAQVTRTFGYALFFTVILSLVNTIVLSNQFDLQATWAAFALAMSQVGAFFALRRSNESRAYLGDVRLALH